MQMDATLSTSATVTSLSWSRDNAPQISGEGAQRRRPCSRLLSRQPELQNDYGPEFHVKQHSADRAQDRDHAGAASPRRRSEAASEHDTTQRKLREMPDTTSFAVTDFDGDAVVPARRTTRLAGFSRFSSSVEKASCCSNGTMCQRAADLAAVIK